jgi:hypothetical protein
VQTGVVSAAFGIGSSHDSAARRKSGVNASFGNADLLLLHSFVQTCSVLITHLVELVYQAYTLKDKHHTLL